MMDPQIKIARRFRTFRGSRIIPAAASHRFTFPSFFPSKNKSRSDAISVTTSVISIEFVQNRPDNASSFVSLPLPRHLRDETTETIELSPPATIDSFPITESPYQLGSKIVDEPDETLSSIYTDLNMSSNTDSQTTSPTSDQGSQTWDEHTSQTVPGLTPAPRPKHNKAVVLSSEDNLGDNSNTVANPKVADALRFPGQGQGQIF
ncbi:hypothetical protein QCA50_003675 [Cerrena zonata]|uniref:Uncharacterized protein n=1 Tax=Cerrena zonata TaxID=2478898 RepID=A0AAW0GST4_9APHY